MWIMWKIYPQKMWKLLCTMMEVVDRWIKCGKVIHRFVDNSAIDLVSVDNVEKLSTPFVDKCGA